MKLDFRQVVVAYVITALVINPAMAQQQTAQMMKQQQMRAVIEKLSVDRQQQDGQPVVPEIVAANPDIVFKESLNGTTVVDIAAPSAKGVSNNNWNEFNVGEEGIIFNNSAKPVLTQLGGWTDGNRRLAGGEASIILNQVNGANRSNLLGAIEVAGKSAEFILANPNGITCNGCGFINTPSVSLITGQSRLADNGDLTFDITGGDFLLEGKGLNATNTDRFDIVTRYAQLNANLYAKNANVLTGVNSFDYQTKSLTAQAATPADNIQFSFDTTALGAMYANSIRLVGTEKGLGINLQGLVQSTQDLEITADGNLQLKQVQANNQLTLKSNSANVNVEQFAYASTMEIAAADTITNNGFVGAKTQAGITANTIEQNGDLYIGLDENNKLNTVGTLTMTANQSLINKGDFYVGGALDLQTPEINNQGVWLMQSAESLQAGKIINTNYMQFNANNLTLKTDSLVNTGELMHMGNGLLSINLIDNFENTGVFGSNGNWSLQANSLNNQGQIFSNNAQLQLNQLNNAGGKLEVASINLRAASLLNGGGMLLALGSDTDNASINLTGNFDNKQGVFYTDAASFDVNAIDLDNTSGNFIVNNQQLASVTLDKINNQKGFMQFNQLDLTALEINNNQGNWLTGSLKGSVDRIHNNSGFIQAAGINLKGLSLDNTTGVILSNANIPSSLILDFDTQILNQTNAVIRNLQGDIELTSANFTNHLGLVDAGNAGSIWLKSSGLDNEAGSLVAKNAIHFTGDALNNIDGYIESGVANFSLSGDLDNTRGVIQSGINLTAANFINQDGYLLLGQSSSIQLTGELDNQLGVIATDGSTIESVELNARELNNSGEIYVDAEAVRLTATTHVKNSGLIGTTGKLNITSAELENKGGTIDAGQLDLALDNSLINSNSIIEGKLQKAQISADEIKLTTGSTFNDNNSLIFANKITASSTVFENRGLIAVDTLDLQGDKFIQALDGELVSVSNATDSLVFNFITSINNAGQMSRNANWSMVTSQFTNTGRIESVGDGAITADQIINNDLNKMAALTAAKDADATQDSGLISAGKLMLKSASIDNQQGILISNSQADDGFSLGNSTQSQLNNQKGIIQLSANNASWNQLALDNREGSIFHLGNGKFALDLLGNLNNTQGSLISDGDLDLTLDDVNAVLTNDAGLIVANDIRMSVDDKVDNLNAGAISGKNLVVNAKTINNNRGIIEANANDQAELSLNAQVNNINAGEIRSAAKDWNMVLDAINNDGGSLIHTGSGTFTVTSSGTFVNKGVLDSANHLSLNLDRLENNGQLSAANQISIATQTGVVNSSQGLIGSSGASTNFSTQLQTANQQIDNQGYWHLGNLQGGSVTSGSDLVNAGDWVMGSLDNSNNLALNSLLNTGNMVFDSSGKLLIDVNNKIVNSGQLTSRNGQLDFKVTSIATADSGFINSGIVQAKQLQINTNEKQQLVNSNILAAENLQIGDEASANRFVVDNTGLIQSNSFNIVADQLSNRGNLIALDATQSSKLLVTNLFDNKSTLAINNNLLRVEADHISNTGRIESSGDLTLVTRELTNTDLQKSATNRSIKNSNMASDKGLIVSDKLSITSDRIDNDYGVLISQSTADAGLTMETNNLTPLVLNNNNGIIQTSSANWTLDNLQLINKGGALWHLGAGKFTLDLPGNFDNSQGSLVSDGNLLIQLNDSGSVLNNSAGLIAANDVEITTTEKIDNLNAGIISGKNVQLGSKTINNNGSVIEANAPDQAKLNLIAQVNNTNGGLIRSAAKDWNMLLDGINNEGGSLVHQGSGTFTVTSSNKLVNKGVLDSANQLVLNVTQLENHGQISAANQLSITTTQGILNSATGSMGSSGNASNFVSQINAANQQITNQGYWFLGNQLNGSIAGADFINAGQFIVGDGSRNTNLQLSLSSFTNSGNFSYNNSGDLIINANKIVNANSTNSEIAAINGGVQFNVTGNGGFSNDANVNAKRIRLSENVTGNSFVNNGRLQANQFDFTQSAFVNNGILFGVNEAVFNLTGVAITNKGLWVNEATNWTLNGNLTGDGSIYHAGTGQFSIALNSASDLTGAYLETKGSVILQGSMNGGESTKIDSSGKLVNQRTTLVADNITITGSTAFVNKGAKIISNQDLIVNTNLINHANSSLIAKDQLLIQAVTGNPALDITNSGSLQAGELLLIGNRLDNTNGNISLYSTAATAKESKIDLARLINQNGSILVSNLNKNVSSLDSLAIDVDVLSNAGGTIGLQNNVQNSSGVWSSQLGNNKLTINSMDWGTDAGSQVFSDGDLYLSAKGYTTYVLDNNGSIQTLGDLYLDAYGIENRGNIIGSGAGSVVDIRSFSFENFGEVFSNKDVIIGSNLFNNNISGYSSSIKAVDNLTLDLQSLNTNRLGVVDAGRLLTLDINSNLVINELDKLTTSGAMSIVTSGSLINKGEINTKNQLSVSANKFENHFGAKVISGAGQIGYVAEKGGNYFLPSEFNIKNDLINFGLISSQGDLNINAHIVLNNGTFVTGQHQYAGNTYKGNMVIDLNPGWAYPGESTLAMAKGDLLNTNANVIYSNGSLTIKNANLITNEKNASLIGVQDVYLQGYNLQNNHSRIEATTGDLILDFSGEIVNESSDPVFTEDARAYGYSLFSSGACPSKNGHCNVDEEVIPCVGGTEFCSRNGSVYEQDRDRASIWRDIARNGGRVTYTYTASLKPTQTASITAGKDIKIQNNNAVIYNNYGSIYAGQNLEIQGKDLILKSNEYTLGSATVTKFASSGSCSSKTMNNAPCAYYWDFTLPENGLEIFNYGFIRAGGNISGTLAGKVVNTNGTIPGGGTQTANNANSGNAISGTLKNYLDQTLSESVKNSFYTDSEKLDVNSQSGNAASATNLNAGSTGSSTIESGVTTTIAVNETNLNVESLQAKTLDDVTAGNASQGSGVASQDAGFTGAIGSGASANTELLDQAGQVVDAASSEIPALIAKATSEEFKTNQWPLISFTVLPFNFDLKNLSGLYVISQNPDAQYLIETRPEFTQYGKFLGSDYLLSQLGYDADKTIKRLGDAFFENQLIRDALVKETNSVYLGDVTSDYELMQELMDNAVASASKLQLTLGVALTPEQSAALTKDMMWLVKKKVNGQEVLVPHLYLTSVSPEKIAASKSAIAANGNINLIANSITNQSSIQANNLMLVTRGNLQQDGRLFAQGDVRLLAGGQLDNNGSIQANNLLAMSQGQLNNSASGKITVQNDAWLESTQSNLSNRGTLDTNNLTLKAGVDLEQFGNLQAKNDLHLLAGQDVLLQAKENRQDAKNVNYTASNLTAGGNLLLNAGRDIQVEASDLYANGNVGVQAGRDINLQAMKNEAYTEYKAKRKTVIDNEVTHDLVNIKAGGNIKLDAGQDANLTGTNLMAANDISISADRDTNISAVVDSDYHFDQTTKKRSFGRKKTTTNETLTETVKGGLIMSGGDVMINAHKNDHGEIITEKSGKVNLLGTNIMAGVNAAGEVTNQNADVVVAADEDVNISGIVTNQLDFHQTKKKGIGGLKKTDKGSAALEQLIENAAISAGGNVNLISNNNLNLLAADVVANGEINMEAVDQLLITAGEVKSQTQNWSKSSGVFTNDSIYNKREAKDGKSIVAGQASNIVAKGDINIQTGSGEIIGSNLVSGGNITGVADTGDLSVKTYESTLESYQYEKEIKVGLGDIGKNLSRPDQWVQNKDGRASIKFADATYDEVDTKTQILDNQKSVIKSDGDITLISNAGSTNIIGSDLIANADKNNGGNVNLAGVTGVNIEAANNTQETKTKETHGSAEMSFVVQHQAVEVAKAVIALEEAEGKLEDAKRQYKDYKRNLSDLERQLDQLEQDVKNKVPGASADDLVELRLLVEDVKGDEDFMQAGVALAAVNVATSTTAVVQQTAAAAASTATWGFNAGVQLDIDAQQNTTHEKSKVAQGSYVSANQIRIQTGKVDENGKLQTAGTQVNVTGSELIATQNEADTCENCDSKIQIRTGDLNLVASTNTTETSNENKQGHITAQMTVYGSAGGASVSGSYSQNKSTSRSTTHNNTQLNADTIELTTSGDLNIAGANVDANKHLEVDVQGDMNVESKQDRSSSRTAGVSLSGGVGFGGDNVNNKGTAVTRNVQGVSDVGTANGVNAGVGVNNGSMNSRTTVLSTLTSGGTANINVDGHTQNTGALIATVDKDGNDLGNLNFNTGSYDFVDLKNTYNNSQTNLNISGSASLSGNQKNPRENQTTAESADGKALHAGNLNVSGAGTEQVLARENSQSKTLATLGHGNITIGGVQLEKDGQLTEAGQSADPLILGNRDTQSTDKSLVDSQYNLSVNASIDTRLFSENGWQSIAKDAKESKDFGKDIWNTGVQISNEKDLNALDYMATLDVNAKSTQIRNEVINNKDLLAKLQSDDRATQAQGQQQLAIIAQEKFGLSPEEISGLNFYDGEKTTSTSLAYQEQFSAKLGGVVTDPNHPEYGQIHIMANDKETMVNTAGHEVLEKVTLENGSRNDASQEARARIAGDRLTQSVNEAVGGSLNASSGSNFVSDFTNSSIVVAGTQRANSVGNTQVDNRQLETEELKFIKQQAPVYAARHEGMTEEEARGILTKQALSMVDARWKKRLSEEGFTGDSDAEAFLKNQAGPQVVSIVRKDGTHTQTMFTSTDAQFQDFYYNSYQSYMAEKGIVDNPAYHATYNPVPHLIDDEFRGWLNQYAVDGKVTDLDANFVAENKKDSVELWDKSAKLIDEKGWSVIPFVGGKLVDSVGEAVDTCKKGGLNCFIPTSKIEGDGFEKAYMDKLVGDQQHYSDNLSKGFWDAGLTIAEVGSLGLVTLPKKAGKEIVGEVVDIVDSNSKNYYEILNVAEDASPADIKNAYRRAASENHPDRNADPEATSRMQEINEAYDALSGKSKRSTEVVDSSTNVKRNNNSEMVPAGSKNVSNPDVVTPRLPVAVAIPDVNTQPVQIGNQIKQPVTTQVNHGNVQVNNPDAPNSIPTTAIVGTNLIAAQLSNGSTINTADIAKNTATDLRDTRDSLIDSNTKTHSDAITTRMDNQSIDLPASLTHGVDIRNNISVDLPGALSPKAVNIEVPEHVWPQPYPPLAEGATRIAEIERVRTNQVTGAFQGEVKESIVQRKMEEIQAILNSGPDAAKQLPVVRMAPDPVNPNGLVLTDQTHTFEAYRRLGFDDIPASVYNSENGVPFLIKQQAYQVDNYAPIQELRSVSEFSGSPSQQAAARRAALQTQQQNQPVSNSNTQVTVPGKLREDTPSSNQTIPDSFFDELEHDYAPNDLNKSTAIDAWANSVIKRDVAAGVIDNQQMAIRSANGIEIPRRPTAQELENLSRANGGVEFAVSYELGNGPNGRGGQYYLHMGHSSEVDVVIDPNRILISHVHPGGSAQASLEDMQDLALRKRNNQQSSTIIPVGKEPIRYTSDVNNTKPPKPDPLPADYPRAPISGPVTPEQFTEYKALREKGYSALDAAKLSGWYADVNNVVGDTNANLGVPGAGKNNLDANQSASDIGKLREDKDSDDPDSGKEDSIQSSDNDKSTVSGPHGSNPNSPDNKNLSDPDSVSDKNIDQNQKILNDAWLAAGHKIPAKSRYLHLKEQYKDDPYGDFFMAKSKQKEDRPLSETLSAVEKRVKVAIDVNVPNPNKTLRNIVENQKSNQIIDRMKSDPELFKLMESRLGKDREFGFAGSGFNAVALSFIDSNGNKKILRITAEPEIKGLPNSDYLLPVLDSAKLRDIRLEITDPVVVIGDVMDAGVESNKILGAIAAGLYRDGILFEDTNDGNFGMTQDGQLVVLDLEAVRPISDQKLNSVSVNDQTSAQTKKSETDLLDNFKLPIIKSVIENTKQPENIDSVPTVKHDIDREIYSSPYGLDNNHQTFSLRGPEGEQPIADMVFNPDTNHADLIYNEVNEEVFLESSMDGPNSMAIILEKGLSNMKQEPVSISVAIDEFNNREFINAYKQAVEQSANTGISSDELIALAVNNTELGKFAANKGYKLEVYPASQKDIHNNKGEVGYIHVPGRLILRFEKIVKPQTSYLFDLQFNPVSHSVNWKLAA